MAIQCDCHHPRPAVHRHQAPVTLLPPDVTLNVRSADLSLRMPLQDGARRTLLVASASGLAASLTVSDGAPGTFY